MSLILEALRKSEAERRRGQSPDLYAPLPPVAPPPARSGAPWLWGAGALAVAVAIGVWLLRSGPAPGTAEPAAKAGEGAIAQVAASGAADGEARGESAAPAASAAPSDPGRPAAAVADAAIAPAPIDDAAVAPAAARPTDTAADATQAAAIAAVPSSAAPVAAAATPSPSTVPAAGQAPAIAAAPAAAAPAQPASIAPPKSASAAESLPIAPPAAAAAQPAGEGGAMRLADLSPEARKQLPPLKLSMHMWNEEPARRFVIVDGQRLGEGDRIGEAVLVAIRPDGAVLDWNGRRLQLSLR